MGSSIPSSSPTWQSPPGTNNQNNRGVIDGSGNIVNSFNNAEKKDDVELDRLLDGSISKSALHDNRHAPPECHPGTRKTVLKEVGEWIDNSGGEKSPLLWLHGPAGVGKSVIAKTIAGSHHQVVATFFFATSTDRSAATLFPTLSWQLARKVPETKQHIIASLKNDTSLLTSDMKKQFDHLIVQPLKKFTFTSLPVMIIDGIDECTDDYALSQFLQALVRAAESGDVPLRFIIFSRPEPRIRAMLKKRNDRQESQETEYQPSVPRPLQH